MKTLAGFFALLAVSLFVSGAMADEQEASTLPPNTLSDEALVEALRSGGYVIYLRHTATDREQVDQVELDFDTCSTQRNLSDHGREQAVAIGEAFRALDIELARVISSPYCRAQDTAMLAFGHTETSHDLRFSIGADMAETAARAEALRGLLATAPAPGGNVVVVAHTANLKDAADLWPKPEGVAAIFRPMGNGGFEYVGSVLPDGWSHLVELVSGKQQATRH